MKYPSDDHSWMIQLLEEKRHNLDLYKKLSSEILDISQKPFYRLRPSYWKLIVKIKKLLRKLK